MNFIVIGIGILFVLMFLLYLDQEELNPSKPNKNEAEPVIVSAPAPAEIQVVTKVLTPLELRIIQQTLIREKNKLSRIADELFYDSRELRIGEHRLSANEARITAEDRILDVRSVSQDLRDFDFGLTIRDEQLNDKERKLDLKAKEELLKLEDQRLKIQKKELQVLKEQIGVYARHCINELTKDLNKIVYLSDMLKVERASIHNERYANKLHLWNEKLDTFEDYLNKSYKLLNKELHLQEREGVIRVAEKRLGLKDLYDRTNNAVERLRIQESKGGGFFKLFQSRTSALEELIETHQIWTSYR